MSIQWISPSRLALLNVVLDLDPDLRSRVLRAFEITISSLTSGAADLRGDAAAEVHFLFERGADTIKNSVDVEETLESARDALPMHFGSGPSKAAKKTAKKKGSKEPSNAIIRASSEVFDYLMKHSGKGASRSTKEIKEAIPHFGLVTIKGALALLLSESPNSVKTSGKTKNRRYWHTKS